MNDHNLIPNNQRSPSEVRENGRKGGVASGETRRAKKTLRERVKMFGELKVEGRSARAMIEMGIAPEDTDRFTQAAVSLFQKALKGDVAAFNAIRDIIGEKPVDETKNVMSLENEITINFVETGVNPVNSEDDIDTTRLDTF